MRPVNLIPPEERRGEHGPTRTGPIPYIVLGLLVAVLAGVTALVLTNNQISDRKAEVAKLEREDTVAKARAEQLAAYTQFRAVREQRVATVASLANSRFDWERVMRELSLVLPSDVWLTNLEASAGGDSAGGGSSLSGSIAGPSLEVSGCATGQEAVAGFVTALKDIDGVTRVGIESSELPNGPEGAGSTSGSSGGAENCQTRDFITKFKMVVAFDAAPVPITESSVSTLPSATETAQTTSTETSESGG